MGVKRFPKDRQIIKWEGDLLAVAFNLEGEGWVGVVGVSLLRPHHFLVSVLQKKKRISWFFALEEFCFVVVLLLLLPLPLLLTCLRVFLSYYCC